MPTLSAQECPDPAPQHAQPAPCYSHHGHAAAINDHSPQPLVPRLSRQVQLEGCIQGLMVSLKAGHCAVRLWLSRRLPWGPLPSPQEPAHLRGVLTTGSQSAAGPEALPPGLPLVLWEGSTAPQGRLDLSQELGCIQGRPWICERLLRCRRFRSSGGFGSHRCFGGHRCFGSCRPCFSCRLTLSFRCFGTRK